ncbi:MAG: hypothetical protein JO208_09055 [Alphaproteobacteria bacterium]|nr:hypothetical protein [Alphaproteobacteria bacterium]
MKDRDPTRQRRCKRLYACLLIVLGCLPASAKSRSGVGDRPVVLGVYKDWSAYSRGDGDRRVCYALSAPKAKEPAGIRRDPAYFLVNDWPGRQSKAEAEVVPGYTYKEGSTVTVQIGTDKFIFFTKNEGRAGGAWVLNPADQEHLLRALRSGITAVVTGTSKRGTNTKDVYGLSGVGEAMNRIHDACGM